MVLCGPRSPFTVSQRDQRSERGYSALTRKGFEMRFTRYLSCALLAAAVLGGGAASAANICRADKLTCSTNMAVGGFCQCTANGSTQDGTVVSESAPDQRVNSTAGGCGAQPADPGCR